MCYLQFRHQIVEPRAHRRQPVLRTRLLPVGLRVAVQRGRAKGRENQNSCGISREGLVGPKS